MISEVILLSGAKLMFPEENVMGQLCREMNNEHVDRDYGNGETVDHQLDKIYGGNLPKKLVESF